MPNVSAVLLDHLKKAVASGVSVYAIAKATGISQPAIGRFLSGERKQIRSETIDKLAVYFGLELCEVKSSAVSKPKPPATRRKKKG